MRRPRVKPSGKIIIIARSLVARASLSRRQGRFTWSAFGMIPRRSMMTQCRTKLRESRRFIGEDFMFLDPLVANENVDEEGEVEIVDEPPAEGGHVDVGGDCP
ncbi:UNVERIFIED_CONTAM: hypothetical protein Sangu_2879800 [Sesamum angustifolium]|uniref:Uncharacterized protein n=1 Tax=Sesamum angustifolium TaxID=2727405 RepID=A0AAW2INL3_9LAMI